VRAVPRLCGSYPDIFLTTEEKHGKTLVRLAIQKHTMRIHTFPGDQILVVKFEDDLQQSVYQSHRKNQQDATM
jgi:hypothetical protein